MVPGEALLRFGDDLRRLLPTGVIMEVSSEPPADALLPDEASATQTWAAHRRTQFATGRACARRALARLGCAPAAILFDQEGAPLWPRGVVGSISHKREHCIVAVAPSLSFTSLGLDLERDASEAAEAEIVQRVCRTVSEFAQIPALRSTTRSPGTLFLSAKEAFFKFQFPITRARLNWGDVEMTFRADGNAFSANVLGEAEGAIGKGVFAVADGWLATFFAHTTKEF